MTFDAPPVAPAFPLPGGFLDARVEINANGWKDISSRIFMDTTSITRGHPDESTTASPSTFTAQANNSDGALSDSNPLGPYYPFLGLNTPVRVSFPEGASYLRLENGDVSGWSAQPASNTVLASGFDVQVDVSPDNWFQNQPLFGEWQGAGSKRSFAFYVGFAGDLLLEVSPDGVNGSVAVCPVNLAVNPHGRLCVRAVWNASTQTVTFYTAPGATLSAPTWTLLGQVTGFTISPMWTSGSVPGAYAAGNLSSAADMGALQPFTGKVHAAIVKTLAGTTVASPDFTAVAAGATSATDAQGNTWSAFGSAEVSDRKYRFHGEVSAWPQSWTPGDPNVRVSLTASGLLRQLGTVQTSTQSAMFRAYSRSTAPLLGYWPCEDGSAATQVASGIGGPAGVWSLAAPQVSSFSGFLCSSSLPVLNGATLTCPVPAYADITQATPGTTSDAVVRFLLGVPAAGDINAAVIASVFYVPGGTVSRVDLSYGTGGSMALTGYSGSGAQVWSTGAALFGVNGGLLRASIELRNVTATTYTAAIEVLAAGSNAAGGIYAAGSATAGVAGKVTNVSSVVFNTPGGTALTQTAIGHVSVESAWSSLFNMAGPLEAWVNEPAGNRFGRLCNEEGIAFRGVGNMNDTVLMGPQTQETVSTLVQECADADRGMWFEPRECLGFAYRDRVSIGNQAPTLVLDYNQDQLSNTLSPTKDDQTVKNDVTVTNQSTGSTARQFLNDGSALAVNGRAGRYDTQITANLASDMQLNDEAGWALHAMTVNEPRYTAVSVDLANTAMASLWFKVLAVDIGDRAQVSNPPLWLPPGLIDQIAQGVTETFSLKDLQESWNTVPATPWNVSYYDDPIFGRCDTDGSTLASSVPAPQGPIAIPDVKATGWTAYGAGIASTPAPATSAVAQWVQWTSNGTAYGNVQAPSVPLTAATYTVTGLAYSTSAVSANAGVSCRDVGGNNLGDAVSAITIPAATVTPFTVTVTAGGAVVSGFPEIQVVAPSSGQVLYVTCLTVTPGTGAVSVASTPNTPLWTTTAGDFPFDVSVGGERLTVLNVTGTSSPQVFTVARGINGIGTAHSTGDDVRLFYAPIYGL